MIAGAPRASQVDGDLPAPCPGVGAPLAGARLQAALPDSPFRLCPNPPASISRRIGASRRAAFTLVELLVVIAIIGATAGVLGVALRGDNPAAALQSAQGTVASLLSAARSEAALKNSSAAVVVYAVNDGSDRYLRALAVADFDGTHWARSGDYIQLPTGVYVVPPESASPAPSNALTPFPVDGVNHYGLAFTAVGTPAGNGRIVLAAARRTADGPVFDNAANVRGLVVSAYGAVTFVNDASGFAQ